MAMHRSWPKWRARGSFRRVIGLMLRDNKVIYADRVCATCSAPRSRTRPSSSMRAGNWQIQMEPFAIDIYTLITFHILLMFDMIIQAQNSETV